MLLLKTKLSGKPLLDDVALQSCEVCEETGRAIMYGIDSGGCILMISYDVETHMGRFQVFGDEDEEMLEESDEEEVDDSGEE